MLLVLDNMEHLLAAADEVAAVVHASPASRVLVTSRAPLHIAGEHEFPVAPLVDDAVAPLHRARASGPAGLGPRRRRRVVAEICRPARRPAARDRARRRPRRSCSPTVIRDRLAARLPLPGSGPRDAPARQRTLEGAVAWSHDLLDCRSPGPAPSARRLRGRLRPRAGRRGRRSVGGRAAIDLDALLELADQSLIVAAPTPRRQGEVPHAADDPVVRARPAGGATASRPTFAGATPRPISPWRRR